MSFNSFQFLIFLPAVYLIFYITPQAYRWVLLLCTSYAFYASFHAPYLLAVLLLVTGISYLCGLRIAAYHDESARLRCMWTGIFASVAVLILLKYLPFIPSDYWLGAGLSPGIVTVGVSYFTFQAISYIADVYLRIEEPERHFGYFALYLAFFPKLLQGPIERAGDLLPQLKQPYRFHYGAMRSALLLFFWGLFKKVVIADRLALSADQFFNNVNAYTGISVIVGIYIYALQIYFDFSGYTDMARGVARMFGINLTENFASPYLATSIAEFWRRWHISFSRWILDYIFKPLQFTWRRGGRLGTAAALLVTFLLSGIWHGATGGYLIWGALHGLYMAASSLYRPHQKKLYKYLGFDKSKTAKLWQMLVTFNLVSFAWIFFRAKSVGDAFCVIRNIWHVSPAGLEKFTPNVQNAVAVVSCISLVVAMEASPTLADKGRAFIDGRSRWVFYYVFAMMVLLCGLYGKSEFIYGRF